MPTAKKKTPAKKKATKKATTAKKKTVAKKAVAKKVVAEKKAPDNTLAAQAKEILPRLRAGSTTIGAERDRLGHSSNVRLRGALIALLDGSKQAYFELIGFRTGKGKGSARAVVVMNDKNVKVIHNTKVANGWKLSTMVVRSHRVDVLTSPEGVSYVVARTNERADLIVDYSKSKTPGLERSRWRALETSGKARAAKKEEKAVEGRKKAKKTKKVTRKQN